MQFKQVAGQQSVKQELIQLAQAGSIPHALLFAGKEGTGGLPLVLAFAQYLLCEQRTAIDSCGVCPACIKAAKLVHPDLHLSFPAIAPKPGTKALSRFFMEAFREFVSQSPYGTTFEWLQFINAENKQGNIPAEECREIIENLSLKAFEGGHKIQVLWRPEYLGKEGNILLKLIEEPPADTLIFLVAEDADDIIQTILSRTQLIKLLPIGHDAIAQALSSNNKVDEKRAIQIAHLSEGSYTKALQLLRHHSEDMLPAVKEWMQAVVENKGIAIHQAVESMAKQGREIQKNLLLYLQQLLAYTLRASVAGHDKLQLPEEERMFIGWMLSCRLSPDSYRLINDSINKALFHIERNAHSKTQLMYLSLQLQYHIKGRELKVF